LTGGLPEYVKTREPLIISSLMEDIIVRDIAVRHAIRDVDSLKQLAVYLLSNVGKPVSANRLTGLFGIRSGTTVLEYFNYFRNAYLIEFLPQFSYSLKAQSRNPKKVYAMDNSLISAVSTSFTEDLGRKLENLVYLHLRRTYQELYFYAEGGECDFVAFEKGRIRHAIQVCFQIDDSNFEREYQGLVTAMKAFGLTNGTIVTLDQTDHFEQDEMQIAMVPA